MTTSLQSLLSQQQELNAQQTALAAEIAARAKPLIEEAKALLDSDGVVALKAQLTTISGQLPGGQAKTQIENVVKVIEAVSVVLARDITPPAAPTPVPMMPAPAPEGGA